MSTSEEQIKDPDAGPELRPKAATAPWTETRGASLVLRVIRWTTAHPLAILLASVFAAVLLNFWETRGQTLLTDEWARFYFPHTDFESLLRWRTGHLVVLQVGLYKGVFGIFGADSYLPFRIIEALLLGACGLLFYALARCRAGPWPSVLATVVLLFLGSAFEVTATPYGIVILLPVAFGLAALVCLERFPGKGDPVACLLLVAALASQSDALAFLVAGTVLLVVQNGRRFLARIWVVLVPVLLYVAWFAWYRLTQPIRNSEPIYLHNLTEVPSTVLGSAAAGLSAISGFFGTSAARNIDAFDLTAGYFLLALVAVAVILRAQSGWAPARWVWVPVAGALTFWVLLGTAAREPQVARYLYVSALFLLLILLELSRGIRPTPRVVLLGLGAVVVSLVPNLINLNTQAREFRAFAKAERAELGALELARNEAPPASLPYLTRHDRVIDVGGQGFLTPDGRILDVGAHGFQITPATYFAAVDRYGSPAASPEEIASGTVTQRLAADEVLLKAGSLTLSSLPADRSASGRACRSSDPSQPFSVPPSGLEIRPQRSRSDVAVAARRFATEFQPLKVPAGSGPLLLRPGRSQEVRPWSVQISGATVCAVR